MLRYLYVEIDATDAQKQQLAPIVKAAAADLLPLHAKRHDTRRQALELLSQASVDRAALESLQAEKINLVELGSRRLTQALADVLTLKLGKASWSPGGHQRSRTRTI